MEHNNSAPAPAMQGTGEQLAAAKTVSGLIDWNKISYAAIEVNIEAAAQFAEYISRPNVYSFDGRPRFQSEVSISAAVTLMKQAPEANYYYSPAYSEHGLAGKLTKEDFIGSWYVWVDVDPPKDMARDELSIKTWQQGYLVDLDRVDVPPPHVIISSGRGLWLLYRVSRFLKPEEVEAINFGLAKRLGGDSCHSIDHAARLPYTRNSKSGLVSTVLYQAASGTAVNPDELPSEQPTSNNSSDIDLGTFEAFTPYDLEGLRAIVGELECPADKKISLLRMVSDPEGANAERATPLNLSDRSAVLFSFTIKALQAGMSYSQVRNCILSPALHPISAHILDTTKYPAAAREKVARRTISQALIKAHSYDVKVLPLTEDTSGDFELVSIAPVPDDLPPRPWLMEGVLMDGQVSMLTGRGGEGKSLLALQLAMAVATGSQFGWWKAKEARNVLLLNAEDDLDEQRRRLSGASVVMNIDHKALDQRLFTISAEQHVLVARNPDDGKITPTPLYFKLMKLIQQRDVGCLIVDPLVETHAGLDENSNVDMKEVVLAFRRLARACRIPVLMVHHSRKGAAGGDQDGARGGSSIVNACRSVLTMDRMDEKAWESIKPPLPKENYVRVVGAKANYAGRIGDRWLELQSVSLSNGDCTPGLLKREFGNISEGFDPLTWPHKESFLQLVSEGRGNGRSWSTATTGRLDARFDNAVAKKFSVDQKQAQAIIKSYLDKGLINIVQQIGQDRHQISVYVCKGEALGPDMLELPF